MLLSAPTKLTSRRSTLPFLAPTRYKSARLIALPPAPARLLAYRQPMLRIQLIHERVHLPLLRIPRIRNRLMRLSNLLPPRISFIPATQDAELTVLTNHLNHSGMDRTFGSMSAANPGAMRWSERPDSIISTIRRASQVGVRVGVKLGREGQLRFERR